MPAARTLAEKILAHHAVAGEVRPGAIIRARVDRVLLNDVSGPIAFRQFEAMGADTVFDAGRIVLVCDHFAPAPTLQAAATHRVMRDFAARHGLPHFFDAGQGGIEHTLLPEQGLVGPGELIAGGDSHTCTYGAFNAFGTGLGSTDIAAAMALGEVWFMVPETTAVEFRGRPGRFVTGKDLILRLLQEIGSAGAVYQALEFGGAALSQLNMDERMALCNMAVEAGAKTGIVVPDAETARWARARGFDAAGLVYPDAGAHYAAVHRFDLDGMTPLVARPHAPDHVAPVDECRGVPVQQVYIGNCANGTLTDLRQAAEVLRGRRVARGTRLIIVPATYKIYAQALAEGLIEIFVHAGAVVAPPSCGACFGGHMGLLDDGEVAVTTTNRNFRGRMGHPGAGIYLANAWVAAAAAVAGEIVHPAEVLGPAGPGATGPTGAGAGGEGRPAP